MTNQFDTYLTTCYQRYSKLVVLIAIVCLGFNVGAALAWLIGNGLFYLNIVMKHWYFDYILTMKSFNKFLYFIYYVLSLGLLILPSVLGYFLWGLNAVWMAFFGTIGFKFFVFFNGIFMERGNSNKHSS